ncbi:MAG: PIN domain-containing protein [archaeon]
MQNALCDTSVFLPLWTSLPTPEQEIFSNQFFQKGIDCVYFLNVCEATRSEIINKYAFLHENYLGKLKEFADLKKLIEFENPSEQDKKETLNLLRKARNSGYQLSFVDSLLLYTAKKKKLLLLSWDNALVEFAQQEGVDARTPSDLE